jgi:hypothetical protein
VCERTLSLSVELSSLVLHSAETVELVNAEATSTGEVGGGGESSVLAEAGRSSKADRLVDVGVDNAELKEGEDRQGSAVKLRLTKR